MGGDRKGRSEKMPNWCTNNLTITGNKETVLALMDRAASGEHNYVGPFNNRPEEFDWGSFTPIQMELLMKDDDLFIDKSDSRSLFSFHAFVPVPREIMLSPYDPNRLKEMTVKYPEWFSRFPNLIAGYDWEHKNFGVKWGANSPEIEDHGGDDENYSVTYSFDTAWAPPTEFLHRLSALYPTLSFEHFFREEGMGFEGDYRWEDGKCVMADDRDYESEEEDNYSEDS
jgi:hypothetical protein